MRAGLIAAALVAAAAAPQPARAAAPAPVPCTNIGSGHYQCDWYPAGNGYSGGSLVVVGTTTVGYLPQGKNWIVCQQAGGDVSDAAGDHNTWFGYTEAQNGKWGWASAIQAQGGDNYGQFGGGTPNCNGAHGSPPAWSGTWGSPPAPQPGPVPTPAPVDRDGDGFSPPADCDDTDSHVYPGAREVPGDGIDQDCNGSDAAGRLSATVATAWTYSRTSTRVRSLRVTEAPSGASVSMTCTGRHKGCPRPRTLTTDSKGRASLTRYFRHRLRPGARVEVVITAPNSVGKVKRFTIRRGHLPRSQTLCLAPGAAKPSACG
jgi:hypothetical protein